MGSLPKISVEVFRHVDSRSMELDKIEAAVAYISIISGGGLEIVSSSRVSWV